MRHCSIRNNAALEHRTSSLKAAAFGRYFLIVVATRVLLDVLAALALTGLRLAAVVVLRLLALAAFFTGFLDLLAMVARLGSSSVMRWPALSGAFTASLFQSATLTGLTP
jgi:hypothetical protein